MRFSIEGEGPNIGVKTILVDYPEEKNKISKILSSDMMHCWINLNKVDDGVDDFLNLLVKKNINVSVGVEEVNDNVTPKDIKRLCNQDYSVYVVLANEKDTTVNKAVLFNHKNLFIKILADSLLESEIKNLETWGNEVYFMLMKHDNAKLKRIYELTGPAVHIQYPMQIFLGNDNFKEDI